MNITEFIDRGQNDLDKIHELMKDGHSYHCSCKMIWGDGECECGIKSKEILNEG